MNYSEAECIIARLELNSTVLYEIPGFGIPGGCMEYHVLYGIP